MAQKLADFELVLVGCGRMGGAIARGAVAAGALSGAQVICLDVQAARAEALAEQLGGRLALDIGERPRVWLIAVKPAQVSAVIEAYAERMTADDIVVSVAAGVELEALRQAAGERPSIVRAMPNTPALVGRGVSGLMADNAEVPSVVKALFASVGHVVELGEEAQFDGLTGLSGSGPAYIFVAIEALADAGVLMGLERTVARELAVHTVGGAAALVESDLSVHSAELKDRVASPGGTTIRALAELEARGFRHALIEAVRVAAAHSRAMGEDR